MASAEHGDVHLAERVRSELARRVHELDVAVLVLPAATRAVLSGRVATAERRAQVEQVARGLLPAYEIHNHITLAAMGPPEREELA